MIEFTPTEMNLLQSAGIISDLCVTSEDVWWEDAQRAVEYLKKEPPF